MSIQCTASDSVWLVEQAEIARDRFKHGLDLIQQASDLRQQLDWGIMDVDQARDQVDAFIRACDAHRRQT